MTAPTFHKLSWTQFEKDCLALYPKIKHITFDCIVSISRGGTVVSRIISDLLETLPISHITISSYHDLKKLDKPILTEESNRDFTDHTVLLIDEVSDTGETFHVAVDYLKKKGVKKIYTLSPYIKPHTTFHPDFWTQSIDAWIIFPYDILETAQGFIKMLGSKEEAQKKLLEVGFEPWELDVVGKI
ncbi:phosphoribosyltransferase [soil metagenome]